MLKRIAAITLMAVLAIGFLTSCGGKSSSTTTTTTTADKGSLTVLVSDLPGPCDVVSFPFHFDDLALTGTYNAATVPVNAGLANPPTIGLDLGCLRDFRTVLTTTTANAGTYNLAQIWISEAKLLFYDPTLLPPTPPINSADLTLAPLKQDDIPISPPLTIFKNNAYVLQIDFDMAHSIQTITTDTTTGKLDVTATPVITVQPLTASGSQGFGVVDDLVGFVRSVTPPTPGKTTPYNGSFALQLLSNSINLPPVVTINLNDSSQLYGFSALNQLVTDSVMEVDAYIDDVGNFVATSIEDEYAANPATNQVAFIGPVTAVRKDSSGNVTSLDLWTRDIQPSGPTTAGFNTVTLVNVSPTTTYQYSSRSVNFANLPFGAGNITVGQELAVEGTYTTETIPGTSSTPSYAIKMTADKVYDKLQSIQGNFSLLVQAGSDDKTGGFTFVPCSKIFQGASAMVLTSSATTFVNVSGLAALSGSTNAPTLVVKGLPFYEVTAQTINGVPVPAGTLVILAKQVHLI